MMWKDPKFQARCTSNTLNRSKQTIPHIGRSRAFVAARYSMMKEIQDKAIEDGETPLTVDQIVDKVLGTTSGYIKGLGYGPKPTTSRSSSFSVRTVELEESLRATQDEASKL